MECVAKKKFQNISYRLFNLIYFVLLSVYVFNKRLIEMAINLN